MVQLRNGKTTIRQRSPVRPSVAKLPTGKTVDFSSKIDPDIQNHLLTQVDSNLFSTHTPHLSVEPDPVVNDSASSELPKREFSPMQISIPRYFWIVLILGFLTTLGSSSIIFPPTLNFDSNVYAKLNPWTGNFDLAQKVSLPDLLFIPTPGPVHSQEPTPGPVHSQESTLGPVNSYPGFRLDNTPLPQKPTLDSKFKIII